MSFDFTDSSENLIVDDDSDSSDMIGQDSSSGMFLDSDEASSGSVDDEDSSIEILQKPLAERALEAGGLAGGGLAATAGGLAAAAGLTGGDDVKDEAGANSGDSSIKLDDSGVDIFDSSNALDDEEALSFGSSSIRLAADSSKSGKNLTGSDTGDLLDDEAVSKKDSPSDTGKMLGGDDDLLLSEDDLFADGLSLQDSGSFEDSAELSSDFEDSDLVLDDSDSSTEIVLEANDSGINLSPNDSGISLDEDMLELGGSDIDSLELPEDDDMIMLEEAADADAATMMQEDDFNLTPLEEAPEDESSGSQVIALEDSEIYTDESSATILADSDDVVAQPAMMDDGMGLVGGGAAAMGAATGYQDPNMGMAPAPMVAPTAVGQLPEAPFSVFSVISLALVSTLLVLGGMIAYNITQNLWMPEDRVISSGLLKSILDALGWA